MLSLRLAFLLLRLLCDLSPQYMAEEDILLWEKQIQNIRNILIIRIAIDPPIAKAGVSCKRIASALQGNEKMARGRLARASRLCREQNGA